MAEASDSEFKLERRSERTVADLVQMNLSAHRVTKSVCGPILRMPTYRFA
ncbi:MAG: hypothetical protein U0136_13500 [Bdellovibrionota bacterium]